jgi:hypothetical protein
MQARPLSISPPCAKRPLKFPDSLFQLGAFADLHELFACCGELVCLFGRTGNLRAAHWKGFAN